MENNLMVYQSVITDIKNIINAGQQEAYGAASKAMVLTYWNVGKRIVEQEQAGKEHAEYGKKLLVATVYKGNIIKNLIMDCQSYTKYRPNETTGGIFVSWRRKEELPTGA